MTDSEGALPEFNLRSNQSQFPPDLAELVEEIWANVVGGEFTSPALPTSAELKTLLDTCYHASFEREEGRGVVFALAWLPSDAPPQRQHERTPVPSLTFSEPRELSVAEIRRLAPACDPTGVVLWTTSGSDGLQIKGLLRHGRSWERARAGLMKGYRPPVDALVVHVQGPASLRVYQGQFAVGWLEGGRVGPVRVEGWLDRRHSALEISGISGLLEAGLESISAELVRPQDEPPKDWAGFEWIVFANTLLRLAELIRREGHGGTLLLVPEQGTEPLPAAMENLRLKYAVGDGRPCLREAVVSLLNDRHRVIDSTAGEEEAPDPTRLLALSSSVDTAEEVLLDLARLAAVDGALVVTSGLRLVGFGAEIVATRSDEVEIVECLNVLRRECRPLDPEQAGMRHRSAMAFCSRARSSAAIVVSQDGAASLVYSDEEKVKVFRGLSLTNVDMPAS